jgi:DNA-binding response OmpR family regulator
MPDLIILDDDPLFVQLLEDFLIPEGFLIRGFAEARAAVQALGERQPDLLVLDLIVPEVDVITLYRQLRADPATQQLPILISTAAPSYLEAFDAIPDTSRHILVTPYPLAQLRSTLATVFAR